MDRLDKGRVGQRTNSHSWPRWRNPARRQIRAVDPASAEMESVQRALEKVVVDSSKSDAEWWVNLANLLSLSGVPSRELGLALDRLLSSGDPPDPRARARVFLAASNLGRRFTLRRLEADAEIREHFPLQWTDVAVAGGELSAATACIINGVRRGGISASDLILRLPGWFQCLGDRFVPFVTSWYDALSAADQNSIGDWLRRRRIQFNPHPIPQAGVAPSSTRVGPDFPGLSTKSRTFVQYGKRRAASLDGTEQLLTR
jgi:hypothetical protein